MKKFLKIFLVMAGIMFAIPPIAYADTDVAKTDALNAK